MPNVRLRARSVRTLPTTIVLRPALAIAAITRTSTGAALPQALVRMFATTTDVLVSRGVSEPNGSYLLPVPDTGAYYAVATQDGTWDSVTVTWDNPGVTFDRTQSVGGVSNTSLRGVS